MNFRWICVVNDGEHKIGDVWTGASVPSPSHWAPMPEGGSAARPEPVQPASPAGPAPVVDFSSDEAAAKTRSAFQAWRARGGGSVAPTVVSASKAVVADGPPTANGPEDGAAVSFPAAPEGNKP